MYVPTDFAANDVDALIVRLARRWAGVLVSVDDDGTPVGTHMPVLWDGQRKIASGHIARANLQWTLGANRALLVLGGAEAYVSPSWYPSKSEHGKAVPTWNYEAVHLSGRIEWFDEPSRLEAVLRDLSAFHEHDRAQPWRLEDAPRTYVDALKRGIVGVALHVERIDAKRKLSQNKNADDFAGVERGLAASGDGLALEVAAQMRATRAVEDEPHGN